MNNEYASLAANNLYLAIFICSFVGLVTIFRIRKLSEKSRVEFIIHVFIVIAYITSMIGSMNVSFIIIDQLDVGRTPTDFEAGVSVLSSIIGFVTGTLLLIAAFFLTKHNN